MGETSIRISKIGPIELSDVVSGQAHEHAVAFDELRKRIDKLEEGQRSSLLKRVNQMPPHQPIQISRNWKRYLSVSWLSMILRFRLCE